MTASIQTAFSSLIRQTPLIPLSLPDRQDVWLKLESEQPGGSFKSRGVLAVLRQASFPPKGLVTFTTGNQGIAVAEMAGRLGIPAIVVSTPALTSYKRQRLQDCGGELLLLANSSLDEALAQTQTIAARKGYQFIPLFGHPALMDGYAAIADEITSCFEGPVSAFFPVGSGSLLLANARRLKSIRPANEAWGAEPAVYQRCGRYPPQNRRSSSIADGLSLCAIPACNRALHHYADGIGAIPEAEIRSARALLWKTAGVPSEASAAIALAAVLRTEVSPLPKIAVITGSNAAAVL